MSTKREQIIQALKTKLDTISSATGGVYRSRVYALTRQKTPAVCIEPVSDNADISLVPFIDWSLLVRVAVVVRGDISNDLAPDQVADAVVKDVHTQIMSDQSLGGLTMDIQPVSANFELQPGDQPVGVVSLGFQVRYRTSEDDLSS